MRKVSQTDGELLGLPGRDKQLEELVPAELHIQDKPVEELDPQSSERPHNLLRLLYFPDVVPGETISSQPELLIKLSPDVLVKNQELALCYVFKGAPTSFLIWLHNRLNVKNSLSCLDFKNVGAGQVNVSPFQNASSALDNEGYRAMKGWNLHAFCSALWLMLSPPQNQRLQRQTKTYHKTVQPNKQHRLTQQHQLTPDHKMCIEKTGLYQLE